MKLWSGRLPGGMDPLAAQLNTSLPFDQRLAQQDVRGSLAWAKALQSAGIITPIELTELTQGLTAILVEFQTGSYKFDAGDEDIHTAVERHLGELIGATAGKLHTGRSRNDQVATDFRLWILEAGASLAELLHGLQATLVARAEKDAGVVLPGYTHFQQAQPILFSHWWLAHFWALQRDAQRLEELLAHTRQSPLGCGALAGTSLPIDRFALARELGLENPIPNSLDAIGDRDFAAEFVFWATLTGLHLSRLAEALILYSTREYGFITLSDAYSTGSSLMPQKKNPDMLELIRAKSGALIGSLTALLTTLKGLPSAYDKDLQEDKPPVFAAYDILTLTLPVMAGVIESLTVHPERCRAAMSWQLMATDLADYLVAKGIPFREAHGAVGKAVRRAEELGVQLPEMPLDEWQAIHHSFTEDLYKVFDVEHSLGLRAAFGGTAPEAVKAQLELAKKALNKK